MTDRKIKRPDVFGHGTPEENEAFMDLFDEVEQPVGWPHRPMTVEESFRLAQQQIRTDIQHGTISRKPDDFEDLHSFVDANCYGDTDLVDWMTDQPGAEPDFSKVNEVQTRIDTWLKSPEFALAYADLSERRETT